jgi:DNA-binding transcriptional LysR family regulator
VDSHRLLVFGRVAQEGSMAAAARALGWTQPAVSQHVRRLERDLGTPLLTRTGRGSTLTEAGGVLARHAGAIAARLDAADREVAELVGLHAGTVRLAAFPSAAATLVPSALAGLARSHPGLEAWVEEAEPAAAAASVREGRTDVAVVFAYDADAAHPDLETRPLLQEGVVVVLPTGHAQAHRAEVVLEAFATERWVAGCPSCRGHLLERAGVAGFTPDVRHVTDDYVVAQRLVAEGLGVALLPARSFAIARQPGVVGVPLRGARFHVATVVRPEAERVAAVAAVLDALWAAHLDELSARGATVQLAAPVGRKIRAGARAMTQR